MISFKKVKRILSKINKKLEKEYSKRLLDKIVNNCLLMMWGTYILAWCGKVDIAETLSKTIAASIIAVVVGYLAKSVIENISKHTDTFGRNINQPSAEDVIRQAQEDLFAEDNLDDNLQRDC